MCRTTVVVVYGIPAVLELTERALRDAGYDVLVTSDPHEALSIARTLKVDLIVGPASQLGPHVNGTRILRIVDVDGEAAAPVLQRPFSLEELREAVALALASEEVGAGGFEPP
jgi:DNA-binding response OmpR family regulator